MFGIVQGGDDEVLREKSALALKNMDMLENGLLEHTQRLTAGFQQKMKSLEELPLVGEVRGEGLMVCIECVADRESKNPLELDTTVGERIDKHCQSLGLLLRPLIQMCVLSPPLVITELQIDDMVGILREGITRTMTDLKEEGLWSD